MWSMLNVQSWWEARHWPWSEFRTRTGRWHPCWAGTTRREHSAPVGPSTPAAHSNCCVHCHAYDICWAHLFFLNNCTVPLGFLLWKIQVAFPGESQLQQLCYPTYDAWWAFWCFLNPPNHDMDNRISNMHTDVNASDCTQGVYWDHSRACTESWLWEKNPLPHRGIEPVLAMYRSNILPTELQPNPINSRCLLILHKHSWLHSVWDYNNSLWA